MEMVVVIAYTVGIVVMCLIIYREIKLLVEVIKHIKDRKRKEGNSNGQHNLEN